MLEIADVSRSFGPRVALDHVSFTVHAGRLTGFVGQNGSGKSTTMRVILGVLAPDAGEVLFNGAPILAQDRARFGYMPEERGLYPKMRVMEQLVYLGCLHGMTTADALDSATTLLYKLGLLERASNKLESLSLGNQQRTQLAASLVHNPLALILDEPFSGLDPAAVETGVEVLRSYASRGIPVLLSSHQLDVVDQLCDDLVVIGQGRILASGSKEALRADHSRNEFEIRYREPSTDTHWLDGFEGVQIMSHSDQAMRLVIPNDEVAERVLQYAVASAPHTNPVRSFTRVEVKIADILREVTK